MKPVVIPALVEPVVVLLQVEPVVVLLLVEPVVVLLLVEPVGCLLLIKYVEGFLNCVVEYDILVSGLGVIVLCLIVVASVLPVAVAAVGELDDLTVFLLREINIIKPTLHCFVYRLGNLVKP